MARSLAARLAWAIPAMCLTLVGTGRSFAAPYDYDVGTAEELRARDGLPNVLAKAEAGSEVRVAYMGGSITAAAGWRPKTLAWLREQYPGATFREISAAISGTGSDYGACRLREDVLQHDPDLVFLEFRVNGGGGYEAKSMEGIVRQIWAANPTTDICFVYTVGEWMLPTIREGRQVGFGTVMEGIANRYGIPTIELGLEVVRQEAAGALVFRADSAPEGKLLFSSDGVHPTDAGHDLYRDVIARSLVAMGAVGTPGPHGLAEPLDPGAWVTATMLPIDETTLSGGWAPVDMASDPVTGADRGRTEGMLRGARRCDRVGESVTVRFRGTGVALTDVPSVEPIVLEAVIDGGEPVALSRASSEGTRLYARYWWTPEQPPGEHTVTFTVKALPEGTSFYAGQFWIVGEPLR